MSYSDSLTSIFISVILLLATSQIAFGQNSGQVNEHYDSGNIGLNISQTNNFSLLKSANEASVGETDLYHLKDMNTASNLRLQPVYFNPANNPATFRMDNTSARIGYSFTLDPNTYPRPQQKNQSWYNKRWFWIGVGSVAAITTTLLISGSGSDLDPVPLPAPPQLPTPQP